MRGGRKFVPWLAMYPSPHCAVGRGDGDEKGIWDLMDDQTLDKGFAELLNPNHAGPPWHSRGSGATGWPGEIPGESWTRMLTRPGSGGSREGILYMVSLSSPKCLGLFLNSHSNAYDQFLFTRRSVTSKSRILYYYAYVFWKKIIT